MHIVPTQARLPIPLLTQTAQPTSSATNATFPTSPTSPTLFSTTATTSSGTIRAVLSNAAINTEYFTTTIDTLDPATGNYYHPPNLKTIDVNLTDQICIAKAALHRLSQ